MNKGGPIIFIEDDIDDQEILLEVFKSLDCTNEILFFNEGEKALEYLISTDTEPFIIFSDINMPVLSGIELRAKIHENEDLRMKSIPYLFFSTSAEQKNVIEAYSKSVQGFFIKPNSYDKLRETMSTIVKYWECCVSPNYVK